MFPEVFKHTDPNDYHDKKLTLHDCHAAKTAYEDGILRFYFPNGIWIFPQHEESRYDKILRTDMAAADFYAEDMHAISVRIATVQDRTDAEQIWHCNLQAKKPPFCRFCEIRIPNTHAVFHWNELRPDCEW